MPTKRQPKSPDPLVLVRELLDQWRLNARCGRALVRTMKRDGFLNSAARCEFFLVAHDRDIKELEAVLRRAPRPARRKR